MELRYVIDLINRQSWLQPAAESVQGVIRAAYAGAGPAGQQVKNVLHGTWLGHPLHAVLTDIPVGAWSAALLFDTLEATTDRADLAPAADLAVALGAAGALAAALAGFTDWEHLPGKAGKVGLVHASLNTTGLLLYLASFACRRQGQRAMGRGLAYLGYAVVGVSAYLGGELVYQQQIGVDHAAGEQGPEAFVAVLAVDDLAEGHLRRVQAGGAALVLVRKSGRIYAMADTCGHLGCSLAEGRLAGDSIICPCHGSRYALADGRVLDGPSTYDQPYYDTRIRAGQIEVRAAVDDYP